MGLGRVGVGGASLVMFKEDRKRPGYEGNDQVAEFGRPDQARAPSWSWASVDGSLYFPCARTVGGTAWVSEIEVVDVQMDGEGRAGRLVVGGRVGVSDYSPHVAAVLEPEHQHGDACEGRGLRARL